MFVSAYFFKKDIYFIYVIILFDEVIKAIFLFLRVRSKKWIKNLTLDER
jgi:Na+-driven multidrug efflux pump